MLFLPSLVCFAQTGFFVPAQGKIFFMGDTATIFSDVSNQGTIGIGQKAFVNFSGRRWENAPSAQLTDESNSGMGATGKGGILRFLSDSLRQVLDGGYNAATGRGPVFANLHVKNPLGFQLAGSNTKVWKEVGFRTGRIYLNDQVFVVGHNDPGMISGYDSASYFVTGEQPGSGLLVREGIHPGHGLVTFPVGTKDFSYTPAAVRSVSGQSDDYAVSVFDGARSGLFAGSYMADQGVGKTWQIGKRHFPGTGETEILLQHIHNDEGSFFSLNRERSYVSQYLQQKWDTVYPQPPPAPGNLTSGPLQGNGVVNSRTFTTTLSNAAYFTKLVADKNKSLQTRLLFTGYRTGAYIVKLNWQTRPEINVKRFVVERRLANEPSFYSIDSVASLAPNGYSTGFLNYSVNDSNSYRGISFYRLKIIDYNDSSYYSPLIGIRGVAFDKISLWPNPTRDKFSLLVHGHVAKQIILYNSIGQLLWKEDVNERNVIEVDVQRFIPGIYFVTIVGEKGRVISTEKLVIAR